ncbi:MAG: hypothetical protein U1G07_06255 [Verrucomicrobiota bacterium]
MCPGNRPLCWCTDQYIVQRALGAPNETIARRGNIFTRIPPSCFRLSLYHSRSDLHFGALAKAAKCPNADPDDRRERRRCPGYGQQAFPNLVQFCSARFAPGLVVAGLLSALMGSLAGVFNACSTLFTVDLYGKWRPNASQHELVRTGRIATAVMVLIALAWIPVVKGASGLYDYLQAVQGYLAPPIFVVFFCGVFWKRLNAQGCLWAMIVGFIVGVFRMLVDTRPTLNAQFHYPEGSLFWIVNNINFQYFSILITLISAIVMVVVSYMTPPPDEAKIKGLTYATVTHEQRSRSQASWDWRDVAGSGFVLFMIVLAYLYFRG